MADIQKSLESVYKGELSTYYTGNQVDIFLDNIYVDEAVMIGWRSVINNAPVYAYNAELFNSIMPGTFRVEGKLAINFRSTGYLEYILQKGERLRRTGQYRPLGSLGPTRTEEGLTTTADINTGHLNANNTDFLNSAIFNPRGSAPDDDELNAIRRKMRDFIWGYLKAGDEMNISSLRDAIKGRYFDITAVIGNPNTDSYDVKNIVDAQILDVSVEIVKDQPIMLVYTFVARDIDRPSSTPNPFNFIQQENSNNLSLALDPNRFLDYMILLAQNYTDLNVIDPHLTLRAQFESGELATRFLYTKQISAANFDVAKRIPIFKSVSQSFSPTTPLKQRQLSREPFAIKDSGGATISEIIEFHTPVAFSAFAADNRVDPAKLFKPASVQFTEVVFAGMTIPRPTSKEIDVDIRHSPTDIKVTEPNFNEINRLPENITSLEYFGIIYDNATAQQKAAIDSFKHFPLLPGDTTNFIFKQEEETWSAGVENMEAYNSATLMAPIKPPFHPISIDIDKSDDESTERIGISLYKHENLVFDDKGKPSSQALLHEEHKTIETFIPSVKSVADRDVFMTDIPAPVTNNWYYQGIAPNKDGVMIYPFVAPYLTTFNTNLPPSFGNTTEANRIAAINAVKAQFTSAPNSEILGVIKLSRTNDSILFSESNEDKKPFMDAIQKSISTGKLINITSLEFSAQAGQGTTSTLAVSTIKVENVKGDKKIFIAASEEDIWVCIYLPEVPSAFTVNTAKRAEDINLAAELLGNLKFYTQINTVRPIYKFKINYNEDERIIKQYKYLDPSDSSTLIKLPISSQNIKLTSGGITPFTSTTIDDGDIDDFKTWDSLKVRGMAYTLLHRANDKLILSNLDSRKMFIVPILTSKSVINQVNNNMEIVRKYEYRFPSYFNAVAFNPNMSPNSDFYHFIGHKLNAEKVVSSQGPTYASAYAGIVFEAAYKYDPTLQSRSTLNTSDLTFTATTNEDAGQDDTVEQHNIYITGSETEVAKLTKTLAWMIYREGYFKKANEVTGLSASTLNHSLFQYQSFPHYMYSKIDFNYRGKVPTVDSFPTTKIVNYQKGNGFIDIQRNLGTGVAPEHLIKFVPIYIPHLINNAMEQKLLEVRTNKPELPSFFTKSGKDKIPRINSTFQIDGITISSKNLDSLAATGWTTTNNRAGIIFDVVRLKDGNHYRSPLVTSDTEYNINAELTFILVDLEPGISNILELYLRSVSPQTRFRRDGSPDQYDIYCTDYFYPITAIAIQEMKEMYIQGQINNPVFITFGDNNILHYKLIEKVDGEFKPVSGEPTVTTPPTVQVLDSSQPDIETEHSESPLYRDVICEKSATEWRILGPCLYDHYSKYCQGFMSDINLYKYLLAKDLFTLVDSQQINDVFPTGNVITDNSDFSAMKINISASPLMFNFLDTGVYLNSTRNTQRYIQFMGYKSKDKKARFFASAATTEAELAQFPNFFPSLSGVTAGNLSTGANTNFPKELKDKYIPITIMVDDSRDPVSQANGTVRSLMCIHDIAHADASFTVPVNSNDSLDLFFATSFEKSKALLDINKEETKEQLSKGGVIIVPASAVINDVTMTDSQIMTEAFKASYNTFYYYFPTTIDIEFINQAIVSALPTEVAKLNSTPTEIRLAIAQVVHDRIIERMNENQPFNEAAQKVKRVSRRTGDVKQRGPRSRAFKLLEESQQARNFTSEFLLTDRQQMLRAGEQFKPQDNFFKDLFVSPKGQLASYISAKDEWEVGINDITLGNKVTFVAKRPKSPAP